MGSSSQVGYRGAYLGVSPDEVRRRSLLRRTGGVVLLVLAGGLAWVFLLPAHLGGAATYAITTGSTTATGHEAGTLVVAHEGTAWLQVPHVGTATDFLQSPQQLAIMFGLVVAASFAHRARGRARTATPHHPGRVYAPSYRLL